ncbi:PIR protein [Plasmodium vivax]|nr:PIR protein [Plasmodium vivax]
MGQFLGDEQLNVLHTKVYYESLNNGYNVCEVYDFHNKAEAILNEKNELQDVSKKILNALCYVYTKGSRPYFDTNICNFLYFWLGDILIDKLGHTHFFYEVILDLFNTLINKNRKICELPHSLIFKEDFKNVKLIFDCSEDYKGYKKQYINLVKFCNSDYKEHLDTHISNYDNFYSKCKVEKLKEPYCTAFEKYFPNSSRDLLSKLKCSLKPNESHHIGLAADNKADVEIAPVRQEIGELPQQAVITTAHAGDTYHAVHPHPNNNDLDRSSSEMNIDSEHLDHSPPSTMKKSIATAASAAGLLVPPFLVYNFTPVRSWINKLLGRNPIYRNPLIERELIENSYQPYHFDSERNRYNISYRPE